MTRCREQCDPLIRWAKNTHKKNRIKGGVWRGRARKNMTRHKEQCDPSIRSSYDQKWTKVQKKRRAVQVKIGPVDQIGQIPSIKIYQNNKEEVYGSNMTRCREQCDPLIRWATRASPSHKRRSPCCYYVPPLSQNLSNYSRFVWIHPITLNPSGSIGISQDLTRVCPQRQKPGCSAPFKGCSWWEFAFQRFYLNLHLKDWPPRGGPAGR